jgi:tRNA dimethylallyltransferase
VTAADAGRAASTAGRDEAEQRARAPIAIVGATASGKSAVAQAVAERHADVEIVAVDAMQVYRGMDIGTAKPTAAEQARVRHHMIDVAEPSDDYALARYQRDARAALADITARGRRALLVGGTGLYLRALVDDLEIPGQFPAVRVELEGEADTAALHDRLAALDPTAAARMDSANRRRVIRALEVTLGSGRPFSSFGPGLGTYRPTAIRIVGLAVPRPLLDARIDARYDAQLAAGFLDEVRALAARGLSRTARQALGYKELLDHVEGRTSFDEAVDLARRRTHRFARRQERWFRRDPRIRWIAADDKPESVTAAVLEELPR